MLRFFANTIVSRITSSVVLMAMLVMSFFTPLQTLALTGGPSQPEYGQFEPAGSTEMVNLFSGDFTYNIPLLDVEGYPVNIAYNANISMEDEASWVGLGWSLNPGAVNRSLRGLPDEFKGDNIQRRLGMRDNISYGGMLGYDREVSGLNTKKAFNLSRNTGIALGASYNNYRGWGAEMAFDFGLSANLSKENLPLLGGGTGFSFKTSSLDGVQFSPYLGLRGNFQKVKAGGSSKWGVGVNVNYSPSFNSRSGVWDQSWSAGVSFDKGKEKLKLKQTYANGVKEYSMKRNTNGLGVNFSTYIPGSSQAFSPQIPFNTKGQMWATDIKVGPATCQVGNYGTIRGYYSQSGIRENDQTFKSFGYLNEQEANTESSLMDFSREKDGILYNESTNLPVTSHNYDMYSLTAQGMMGAFRPYRNDIGVVFDPATSSESGSNSFGGEVGFGDGVNVGFNYLHAQSKSKSGMWRNKLSGLTRFQDYANPKVGGNPTNNELYYYAMAGEKTRNDAAQNAVIGGAYPVRADLTKISNSTYETSENYVGGGTVPSGASSFNGTGALARKPRNIQINTSTSAKAAQTGLDKKIRNYKMNDMAMHPFNKGNVRYWASAAATEFDRTNLLSSVSNLTHKLNDHVSEIVSTSADGSRYVYGVPVYNLYQKEVTFSTEGTPDGNGYVSYTHGVENTLNSTKSKGNDKGREGYLEATITPPYAHSYLLTAVLSADYVDLTGDGPSQDDYGTYVRFNYSRAGDVAWRSPMTDAANKATFSEGLYSDAKDNKGSYTYGVKQRWYLHSIETKNYAAFFILSDRDDATGPLVNSSPTLDPFSEESSGKQSNTNLSSSGNPLQDNPFGSLQANQKAKKLDKIVLYNKLDLQKNYNGYVAKPIKTVNFEYNYSLCKGIPNQINVGDGKLTLKKIWYSYGTTPSTKGILSPYEFAYNDQADHNFIEDGGLNNANFNYDPKALDRWGNYKPSGTPLDNIKYPYVNQQSRANADLYSRAWCLNTIKTPSGGIIKVDYESDDYAYIMDKRAGQMFKVVGFANGTGDLAPGVNLYSSLNAQYSHLVVDISGAPSGAKDISGNDIYGIPGNLNVSDASSYAVKHYTGALNKKLFFKMKVKLQPNGAEEFVPGYADIVNVTPVKSNAGATHYDRLYIELAKESIGDKKYSTTLINPVTKAALQFGRKYLNDVMYPFAATPNVTPLSFIRQLAGSFGEVKAMLGGVNKRFIDKSYCRQINPQESFVRLINPNMKKLGGGNRVKSISLSDGWNEMMSSEQGSAYTQTFDYTTTDDQGREVSSGVASYEPMLGGDENSHRRPVLKKFASSLSVNDELFTETPVGESLFPNASVGYSRVRVKNKYDTNAGETVKRHGTGYTEYTFYTSYDFPTKVLQTDLHKQPVQPKRIMRMMKLKTKDKLYATQGYALQLNDMHGKARSVKHYAENQVAPISGVTYFYRQNGNELNNTVEVIDTQNTISTEEMGVNVDVINDSRMAQSKTNTFSVGGNISTFSCTFWVPLLTVWPGYSKTENHVYTLGTTKVVQKYGIVDKVVAFDGNSSVETENVLYDKETGEVILTKTMNQYSDPVYNVSLPAHWVYEGMGPGYRNANFKFVHTTSNPVINASGQITNATVKSILQPGDEVAVYDAVTVSTGGGGTAVNPYYDAGYWKGTRYWVIKDRDPNSATQNELYLVDQNGTKANISGGNGNYFMEVTRSGRRNLQNTPVGTLSLLANPRSGNSLTLNAPTKVLSASASEYDDKWQYYASYAEAKEPVTVCTPNYNTSYYAYQKLLNCVSGDFTTYSGGGSFPYLNDGNSYLRLPIYTSWSASSSYPAGIIFPPFSNCGLSISDLNQLLTLNGLSSVSSFPTSASNFRNVVLLLSYNASQQLVIKLAVETGSYNVDYNPVTSATYGTCTLILNKITNPVGANVPTSPHVSFSGFTSNIPGQGANVFQITATSYYQNYNGLYQGAVPCGNLYDGQTCVTEGCVNSMPGNVNPYYQNMRGNYVYKRGFGYMGNRTTGSTQAGGVMKGDVRDDGIYTTFTPFWNYVSASQKWEPLYKLPAQQTNPKGIFDSWVMQGEVNKVDRNGNVLQSQNALKRPSAVLYGYDFNMVKAAADNALYTDIAYDGFEDYDYVRNPCVEHFRFWDSRANIQSNAAHTGRYSMKVSPQTQTKVKGTLNANSPAYTEVQDIVPYNPLTFSNYDLSYDTYMPANGTGLYGLRQWDQAGRFGPLHSSASQTYVLSVWVKLNTDAQTSNVSDYSNVLGVQFKFNGVPINTAPPQKSAIIDGWQKLDYTFTLGANASASYLWQVDLVNNSANFDAYFDDIRIHPFNAGMKSSVYDPVSLRLWAELDGRNFATFYEYDEEGALVRVKRETEKGIYTVKETRSGNRRR